MGLQGRSNNLHNQYSVISNKDLNLNPQSTEAREKHDLKMQNADEYRLKVL